MKFRQLCGFLLGLIGTFFMWQAGAGIAQLLHAGVITNPFVEFLEPEYALRCLAAIAAFLAGLAALTEKRGGAWLAGISSFLFGILTINLVAKYSIIAWRDEAVFLVVLTGLFLCLVVARREVDQNPREAALGQTA